jgi:glucan phosphoethanolaminetransferase (alkaline phosphatase superfamily)
MAVLWAPIAYSQEARPYSALLLFSLLSMYYWLSILFRIGPQKLHPRWSLIAYLCSSVICAYVHFFGLYLLLLQTIFTAAVMALKPREAKRLSSLIAVNVLAVCLFLPWFLVTLDKLGMQDFWIPRPKLFSFVEFLGFLFNRCTNLCAWQSTSYDLLYVVLPLYLGLFIREGWSFLRRGERQESEVSESLYCLVLVLWLVVPFLGAFLKSVYSTPILTDRNLLISLPAAYLLLARSVTVLFHNARLRVAVALVLVALFAGHLVTRVKYYRTECKPQYREAAAFILANEKKFPDSLIIGCSGQRHPLELLNYYFHRLGSPERVELLVCEKDDVTNLEREIAVKKPRFVWWLVAGVREPDASLPQSLEKRLTLLHHQRFFGAHVLLFRVPSTEETAGEGSSDLNTQRK